jgi:6-phosphofructokinase 1
MNLISSKIKKIAVLTSGGDSPGMNAAIRAVVRGALFHGLDVVGVKRGYQGMIEADFVSLDSSSVSHIIQQGGTFLKSARSKEFMTVEGRKKAYENLKANSIHAVVVIGGDGTFTGAYVFSQEHDIPFVGIPGTIDDDIYGTDSTIGYDTALNTVTESVDKIKDTANSHNRMFFVEVMGRDAGALALNSAVACGAEAVFIPEKNNQLTSLFKYLKNRPKSKNSGVILVAEGEKYKEGDIWSLSEKVREKFPKIDIRVSILGHMQRGGSPSANDRILASKLGLAAVETLLDDQKSVMVGVKNDEISLVPLSKAIKMNKPINESLVRIVSCLNL